MVKFHFVSFGFYLFVFLHPGVCGILVLWPGIEPRPPAVEGWTLKPLDCCGRPSEDVLMCFLPASFYFNFPITLMLCF